jgi:NAD(P)-dependent dehydrogenase (short-subunit alcohol dehydrogenase family)
MKPLSGKTAVVAGATRGAGRGIARMLGEAGATVYCSGRSSRTTGPSTGHHYSGRPETIEETAELVTAAGGIGIAVRTDHASEKDVAALFGQVRGDHGGADILVNVATGPHVEDWRPFWEQSPSAGRHMIDSWLWPHLLTAWHATQHMIPRGSGLIVEVTEGESLDCSGQLFFDLAVNGLKRLAYRLAEESTPHGVAALTVVPGFMRTEAIMETFGATAANWREVAETNAHARSFGFIASETPCYVGRAVAALAADPALLELSGGLYSSWELAQKYGFTDVDGSAPDWGRHFAENYAAQFSVRQTRSRWIAERL